jgi:hypothetical protein
MKRNLALAVLAAVALAVATAPADAAKKKKDKGSKAKVTVTQTAPATGYWSAGFTQCGSAWAQGSGGWYPIAAVGSVGCGIVYAVPVMIEGFLFPRAKA